MRSFIIIAFGLTALTFGLIGCGSSSPSTASSLPQASVTSGGSSIANGAANPNAPELVAPGDIPDKQVFIAFTPPGASFSVKVPEGWSRSSTGGTVTFTDKYNSIEIRSQTSSKPPTPASVKAAVQASHAQDSSFKLGKVATVTRNSGSGVRATYAIGSAPNPVTGKSALLAVEHYVFAHNGTTVTLTLSGAKGADNVDPWRTVTNSLNWK